MPRSLRFLQIEPRLAEDKRVVAIAAALGLSSAEALGVHIRLLCWTAVFASSGDLDPAQQETACVWATLGLKASPQRLLDIEKSTGLLIDRGDHVEVDGWAKRYTSAQDVVTVRTPTSCYKGSSNRITGKGGGQNSPTKSLDVGRKEHTKVKVKIEEDSPRLSLEDAWNTLIEAWRVVAKQHGLPTPNGAPTAKRKVALKARLSESGWLNDALQAISLIPKSNFLCGKNDRGWRANIDFLLRPDTVSRINEGVYSDRGNLQPQKVVF